MPRTDTSASPSLPWQIYSDRDGRKIERTVRSGGAPLCPSCDGALRAEPQSRLSPPLILDATAYDLTCVPCQRFWCVVRETQRSLRLIRMRRLVAAIHADAPPRRLKPPSVAEFIAAVQV